MKTYNITAQIYKKSDKYKQTIFTNEVVDANDENHAMLLYKTNLDPEYSLLKIYSVEKISKVVA